MVIENEMANSKIKVNIIVVFCNYDFNSIIVKTEKKGNIYSLNPECFLLVSMGLLGLINKSWQKNVTSTSKTHNDYPLVA